jgi:RNA polymerase sigma-70 factor (ECF subfamily)
LDPQARAELTRLLSRLADGDRAAFDPLFERVWPLACSFATRLLPAADAEDAAQQALLAVFAHAAEYDPARPALPWILGIVAWECRTLRRRRQRRREALVPTPDAQLGPGAPSPEEELVRHQLAEAVTAALGTLAATDLDTLTAALAGDPSAWPPVLGATFRKRLSRALARLRNAFWRRHDAR